MILAHQGRLLGCSRKTPCYKPPALTLLERRINLADNLVYGRRVGHLEVCAATSARCPQVGSLLLPSATALRENLITASQTPTYGSTLLRDHQRVQSCAPTKGVDFERISRNQWPNNTATTPLAGLSFFSRDLRIIVKCNLIRPNIQPASPESQ